MTLKVVTRTLNNKMRLTNVVYQANLNVKIDLSCLVHQLNNVRYNPRIFPGLIYQNRKIGGNCLIFSNGKINCNGACSDFDSGVKRLRRYARIVQRLGYVVRLSEVRLVTASAVHKLSGRINVEFALSYSGLSIQSRVISCRHATTTGNSFYMSPRRLCTYYRYQTFHGFG